jgi:UDP-N-acetylmuramoylalanine--D-glutamate ligase
MKNNIFKNKKVSVLGLGKSGISAVKFLASLGAKVFISEKNTTSLDTIKKLCLDLKQDIKYETGGHSKKVLDSDLIVLSPGISNKEPIVIEALENNKEIWSELELGFSFIKPKKIIAITGTNGKSTTTTLVYEICKAYGYKTFLCGNIGIPVTSIANEVDKNSIVVVEVSSYQLEFIKNFHANSSAVLNVTPDHLYRYNNIEHYALVKSNIFKNQNKDDIGVYNENDQYKDIIKNAIHGRKLSFGFGQDSGDIFCYDKKIYLKNINWIFDTKNIKIPGDHNVENIMASVLLCMDLIKDNTKILDNVISSFRGIEHRIEQVREINGITFYNDSKSTNVDSTLVALKSFKGRIILLMGGREKEAPYSPLIPEIKSKVKNIIAFGEGKIRIKNELENFVKIDLVETMKDAVEKAFRMASRGDIILLSPACASFDQFNNFEERGRIFKEIVNSL